MSEPTGLIAGSSGKMKSVISNIELLAQAEIPLLIVGETGTGKELVARTIHFHSPSRHLAFIPVDFGTIAPTLIEGELFGHVRGAFTGAHQNRQGLLGAAGEGTVFFDEILELDTHQQARLLRVIQDQVYRPLGSDRRIPLRARVITAANEGLDDAVTRGTFRKDLFFRLNVGRIQIPPLRERKEDIPQLIDHFLQLHRGANDRAFVVSAPALDALIRYDWPGNVRELENTILCTMVMANGREIRVEHLPPAIVPSRTNSGNGGGGTTLREHERMIILRTLREAGGQPKQAAKLLGIGKTTIYRKIKQYNMEIC